MHEINVILTDNETALLANALNNMNVRGAEVMIAASLINKFNNAFANTDNNTNKTETNN